MPKTVTDLKNALYYPLIHVNPRNLKIKTNDGDEFKERRRKENEKQSKYYDQLTQKKWRSYDQEKQ